ncbi:hypothetical protein ACQPXB_36050 [Amycolatopsis sp. CA-161197]|uniref:hypothetical protein n=1 Tax=Amycolatopsis sp. CA-161197 TaxID=3239922 RepID=UPI003D90BB48
MTAIDFRRSCSRALAVLLGHAWRTCAACGRGYSDRDKATTEHIETIPGGEDDRRLLCPSCTDAGVGCRAHGGAWVHDGCEHVSDAEVWPADDTDEEPGRSGPYRMTDAPTNPNMPTVVSFGGLVAAGRDEPELYIPLSSSVRSRELLRQLIAPTVVEIADRRTRAEEREANRASEREAVLDRHRDVLAAIPDTDQNAVIRDLLRAHAPVLGGAGELECRGCAQVPGWDSEDDEYEARWPEAPCPTWTTITRLHARDSETKQTTPCGRADADCGMHGGTAHCGGCRG